MKRIISIALVAVMLACCLAGCGAKRDPKYVGKWEAKYMTIDGTKYEDMLGLPISALFRFEIQQDGKVYWRSPIDDKIIQNANENNEITWKQKKKEDDIIILTVKDLKSKEDPRTMEMKYVNGSLVIDSDGTTVDLEKVDEFTEIDPQDLSAAAGVIQNFGVLGS